MKTINCKGRLLSLESPKVMGILNVTPDSFYDGGKSNTLESAMRKSEQMVLEGVDIIDVGGMSSRPGATIISEFEELERVIPIVKALSHEFPNLILSIDTFRSEVARLAIENGARMVNDISAGRDGEKIWNVCVEHNVPYIMMHMKGVPKNMQDDPKYDDVVLEVLNFFKSRIVKMRSLGLVDVILDPGFGFGKTLEHNYRLLSRFSSFQIFECPLLAGVSRKSMLYKLLDVTSQEALNASTAAHMIALINGANILRVHDVKEAKECIQVFSKTFFK